MMMFKYAYKYLRSYFPVAESVQIENVKMDGKSMEDFLHRAIDLLLYLIEFVWHAVKWFSRSKYLNYILLFVKV